MPLGHDRSDLGPRGESLAAQFLEARGYSVLAQNYRAAGAEIDIVARDGDEIVFVEVKTLRSDQFGDPADRVERRKQRHLSRAAICYVREKRLEEAACRFDVVAIIVGEGEPKINHFRDAFDLHPTYDA